MKHNYPIRDLRSDTVTRPDPAMRQAMTEAEVGDDIYGDDPTVNRLQDRMADMLGKEASIFVPSGTMGNLIAMLAHCRRGDEVITARGYHVFCDEAGGAAIVGGIMFDPLEAAADGALEPEAIRNAVKPDNSHHPVSRLLSLENTHFGKAVSLQRMTAAADAGREAGLRVHLDGARLFNAVAELGINIADMAAIADTVSVCFSKGLGCPAGTVLAGKQEVIGKAVRSRKYLGGGMRQVGVLAAAALHALDHHVKTLADDHERAQRFAAAMNRIRPDTARQATNMVFIKSEARSAQNMADALARQGVLILPGAPETRLVFHRDIDDEGLGVIIDAFSEWYRQEAA